MSISIVADCRVCGTKGFELNKEKVFKESYVSEGCEEVNLTYYDCPNCGKRFYVQADNEETEVVLSKCVGIATRFFSLKKIGKKPGKRQLRKYSKFSKDLALSRKALIAKFDGMLLKNERTGKVELVCFEKQEQS